MTIFDSQGKAVSKLGYILHNGKHYTEADIKKLIQESEKK